MGQDVRELTKKALLKLNKVKGTDLHFQVSIWDAASHVETVWVEDWKAAEHLLYNGDDSKHFKQFYIDLPETFLSNKKERLVTNVSFGIDRKHEQQFNYFDDATFMSHTSEDILLLRVAKIIYYCWLAYRSQLASDLDIPID